MLGRRAVGVQAGLYFTSSAPVMSSGSALLDCILGGGWAQNRIINIVGDRSTGKTLLAIEACANFRRSFPTGAIDYIELEAAFDTDYARHVGFPVDVEPLTTLYTVEQIFKYIDKLPGGHRVVVIDSLDAVGTDADLQEDLGEHGYGVRKPRLLSEAFWRIARNLKEKHITLIIVSQVRENISGFGPKYVRSGGKALDFYASQIVWLRQTGVLEKSVAQIKRVMGIRIIAKCTKNKISAAYREAPIEILFSYGMDNVHTSLFWLQACGGKELQSLGISGRLQHDYGRLSKPDLMRKVDVLVRDRWYALEAEFTVPASKYGELESEQ